MTMRDPTTLRALAERLEAGEADREMDAAIAEVLGLVPQYYVRSTSYLYAHEPHYFLKWDASRPYTYSLSDAPWLPPHLTTSVGAVHDLHERALSPRWHVSNLSQASADAGEPWGCLLERGNASQGYPDMSACARWAFSHPAAAWTAAILYALAEEAESER